jgi:prepilin-type N-terminal cleavage/methylation domain-containing protein
MKSSSPQMAGTCGFSLVEMLTVMALVAILSTAAVTSLTGMGSASRLGAAATSVASFLEQARTYAVTQNTYVYVGFLLPASGTPSGEIEMKLLAAASRDGSSVLPAGGTLDLQSANSPAIVIGKPLLIGKISMDTNGTYDPPIPRPAATSLGSADRPSADGTLKSGAQTFGNVLAFTPGGEVILSNGTLSQRYEIGLEYAGKDSRAAVVQIAGLSGQTRVYQP